MKVLVGVGSRECVTPPITWPILCICAEPRQGCVCQGVEGERGEKGGGEEIGEVSGEEETAQVEERRSANDVEGGWWQADRRLGRGRCPSDLVGTARGTRRAGQGQVTK
jgi:hypothetical protein